MYRLSRCGYVSICNTVLKEQTVFCIVDALPLQSQLPNVCQNFDHKSKSFVNIVFFQERTTLSKTHNTALEKLFVNAQKNKENEKKTFERAKKKCRLIFALC